jgi:hypothetical protein
LAQVAQVADLPEQAHSLDQLFLMAVVAQMALRVALVVEEETPKLEVSRWLRRDPTAVPVLHLTALLAVVVVLAKLGLTVFLQAVELEGTVLHLLLLEPR